MKSKIIMGIIIALLVVAVAVEGVIIFNHSKEDKKVETTTEQPKENVEKTPSQEAVTNENFETEGERLVITKKNNEPKDGELVYAYLDATIIEKNVAIGYENGETIYGNNEYEYKIPQININSADVNIINDEIANKFSEDLREIEHTQMLDSALEYEYFVNEDILSLVIIYDNLLSGGFFNCDIYNVNISTGKQVTNVELLEYKDMTEEEFREKLVDSIKNAPDYTRYTDPHNGEFAIDEEFASEQCNKTIKRYEQLSLSMIQLYLGDNGNVSGEVWVYATAGGDGATYLMDIEEGKVIYPEY